MTVQEESPTDAHTSNIQVSPTNGRSSKPLSGFRKSQEEQAILVQDVMTQDAVTASPKDTIENASRVMTKFGISCLVVQADNQILGILTERDVLTRVVASGRDPKEVLVEEVMTNPIITTEPVRPIVAAVKAMIENRIKKLPVVDGSEIIGILTMTDVAGLNHGIWWNGAPKEEQPLDVKALVEGYEGQNLEFKSSFRYSFHREEVDPELEFNCLKAICAFLNASGGDLVIGARARSTASPRKTERPPTWR